MTTMLGGPSHSAALRGPGSMRRANEWVVLERLRSHAPASAPELSSVTGLSRPTVNLALARLEEDRLVRQTGRRTGNAGRSARLWEPHVDTGRVISVDVGAQWVRLALADLGGRVLDRRREPSRALSATDLVHQISRLVAELLESNEVTRERLLSTVVGSPGIYDPASQRLRHASNLPGWDRPTIVGLLTDEFGDSIRFENDIDLAALGEQAAGLGCGIPDFVYLSVGSGVGMGTITGGRLHRGARGAAGEIAFLLVGDSGENPRRRSGRAAPSRAPRPPMRSSLPLGTQGWGRTARSRTSSRRPGPTTASRRRSWTVRSTCSPGPWSPWWR